MSDRGAEPNRGHEDIGKASHANSAVRMRGSTARMAMRSEDRDNDSIESGPPPAWHRPAGALAAGGVAGLILGTALIAGIGVYGETIPTRTWVAATSRKPTWREQSDANGQDRTA